MTQARGKEIFLIAAFLTIIFGAGLIQAGVEMSQSEKPQVLELFQQKPTSSHLRSFEKNLERSSWFSQKLQPVMRWLQYEILKDAGDKALMGRDGWFFYKPSVQFLIEWWPMPKTAFTNLIAKTALAEAENPVPAILHFRDQLAARGIQLLVMPAPSKASIYPNKLVSRAVDEERPVYIHAKKVMEELQKSGVDVLDLFDVFAKTPPPPGEEYYLAQDTHWSPQGTKLAAHAAARRILERGWLDKGTTAYELKPAPVRRHGDVLRMMDLPQAARDYVQEDLHCEQVVQNGGELFHNDSQSEILVIGDSFLRIYELDEPKSAGFIAHLSRELQRPVASIVNDGGASTLVRQELARKSSLLANKKALLWEFVDRDIRFGTEGWRKIPLPQ
ncbi:MAG: hypothetical protein AB1656_24170 [Candidatus Omnitrophota bacterium]